MLGNLPESQRKPTKRTNPLEIRYYTRYVSPRTRALTLEESCTRRIAYDLKIPTLEAIEAAAPGMAGLLDEGPCWLIPIPSSTGSTQANVVLCNAIRRLHPVARIVIGIQRLHRVESSSARRREGLMGLTVKQHGFQRCCRPLFRLPVWFVDNVVTTGTTIQAAHLAFGAGCGLVYADASSCNHYSKTNQTRKEYQPMVLRNAVLRPTTGASRSMTTIMLSTEY